ncbi:MAG TPA: hypothetical protein VM529_00855 [Gemmata sp.]|nr:hypothetical protein [Gemmata sp.]
MMLTLLIFAGLLTISALFMVAKPLEALEAALADQRQNVPLSDPAAETLDGHSGPPQPALTDWNVATVETLGDAEDLLDALEAQGVEQRELVILGNATFAIRWR